MGKKTLISTGTGRTNHVSIASSTVLLISADEPLPNEMHPLQAVLTDSGQIVYVMREAAPAEASDSDKETVPAAPAEGRKKRVGVAEKDKKPRAKAAPAPAKPAEEERDESGAEEEASENATSDSIFAKVIRKVRKATPEVYGQIAAVHKAGGRVPADVRLAKIWTMGKGVKRDIFCVQNGQLTPGFAAAFERDLANQKKN